MQLQVGELLGGELEEKIRREALAITADLLVQALGGDAVERGELGVEQHAMTAQDEDGAGDVLDGPQGLAAGGHAQLAFDRNASMVRRSAC